MENGEWRMENGELPCATKDIHHYPLYILPPLLFPPKRTEFLKFLFIFA
jgi:hypothetical protein